jgi:hypothetical protein
MSQICSPKKYIILDYSLVFLGLTMLLIRPLLSRLYIMVVIMMYAYGIATLYANMIIYTVSVFNVENGYIWIFYLGAQLLPTFNPVMCGLWMEKDRSGFVYFNLFVFTISVITLPFLFKTGQRIIDEKETDLREKHSDVTIIDQDQSGSIIETLASVNDNRRCDSPLPAQLQRLTEVERIVRVSTSVNSIALSIKSETRTYTSGTATDDITSIDLLSNY